MNEAAIFPAEQAVVKLVLAFAERYGYGNLIAHLRRAWAAKLVTEFPNMTWDAAIKATEAAPYPREWTLESMYGREGD